MDCRGDLSPTVPDGDPCRCPVPETRPTRVLRLLEDGRSYRFIALELGLSPTTVMGIAHRHRDAT